MRSVYDKVMYLRKSPEEREAFNIKWQAKSEFWNPIRNPITNNARRDRSIMWKMQQAINRGSNPPSEDEHHESILGLLSTPAALAALTTKDCLIHVFACMFDDEHFENAGWCTTRRRWVVRETGSPLTVAQYNSFVTLMIPLGAWPDNVSWRVAERIATEQLIDHECCENVNLGGGGGSDATCAAFVEFLSPAFRNFARPTYLKKKRS